MTSYCILRGPSGKHVVDIVPGGTELELQLRRGVGQATHSQLGRAHTLTVGQGAHTHSWSGRTHSQLVRAHTVTVGQGAHTHSWSGRTHSQLGRAHTLTVGQGAHTHSWSGRTHSQLVRAHTLAITPTSSVVEFIVQKQ
jgi:hypothetical protein